MTFRKWYLLYQAYKENFDIEMVLTKKGIRYADIDKEELSNDSIPF